MRAGEETSVSTGASGLSTILVQSGLSVWFVRCGDARTVRSGRFGMPRRRVRRVGSGSAECAAALGEHRGAVLGAGDRLALTVACGRAFGVLAQALLPGGVGVFGGGGAGPVDAVQAPGEVSGGGMQFAGGGPGPVAGDGVAGEVVGDVAAAPAGGVDAGAGQHVADRADMAVRGHRRSCGDEGGGGALQADRSRL